MKKADKVAQLVKSVATLYSAYMEKVGIELDTGAEARSWIYHEMLTERLAELRGLGIDVQDLIATRETAEV